jgi:hypothetical protein
MTGSLIALAGAFFAGGLLLFSTRTVRYVLTDTHLEVFWLRWRVRQFPLTELKFVGNRPVFWAERWPNAPFNTGRVLVFRRRRGRFRNLVLTPKLPFEFRAEFEKARRAALTAAGATWVAGETTFHPLPGGKPGEHREKSAA